MGNVRYPLLSALFHQGGAQENRERVINTESKRERQRDIGEEKETVEGGRGEKRRESAIEKETGRQIHRHTNRWRERQRHRETDTCRWREGRGQKETETDGQRDTGTGKCRETQKLFKK